jgi:hypothetical protein
VVASLAMSCALAITPFAVVDSFGFSGIGNHSIPNFRNISSVPTLKAVIKPSTNSDGGQAGLDKGASEATSSSSGSHSQATKTPVEAGSNEPYLMAENSGDNDGLRSALSKRPPVLEKSGYHANNNFPKGAIGLAGIVTMLVDTPEPGSLFLLGTGLLGLALALFWKSAKNTTRS